LLLELRKTENINQGLQEELKGRNDDLFHMQQEIDLFDNNINNFNNVDNNNNNKTIDKNKLLTFPQQIEWCLENFSNNVDKLLNLYSIKIQNISNNFASYQKFKHLKKNNNDNNDKKTGDNNNNNNDNNNNRNNNNINHNNNNALSLEEGDNIS